LLWGGKPAEVVKAAEDRRISIVVSEAIVEEVSRVLTYPKIRKVYQAERHREELIEAILKIVKFAQTTKKVNVVAEHPADNKFIECALASGADYVISGDKHLLKIGSYKKIKMLSVSEFLQVLANK
jgi:putative PIN family toxin of toxin-antitoxin system